MSNVDKLQLRLSKTFYLRIPDKKRTYFERGVNLTYIGLTYCPYYLRNLNLMEKVKNCKKIVIFCQLLFDS